MLLCNAHLHRTDVRQELLPTQSDGRLVPTVLATGVLLGCCTAEPQDQQPPAGSHDQPLQPGRC